MCLQTFCPSLSLTGVGRFGTNTDFIDHWMILYLSRSYIVHSMALSDIFRSHYWDSCSLRFCFLQISEKLLASVLSVSPASCWLTCCEWLGNTCRCCSWHRQLGTVTWCWCGWTFLQGIHSPSLHLVYDFSRLCSHTSVCLFVIISNHDLFLFKGRTKLSCHLFVLKLNLSLVVEVMQHEMGWVSGAQ